MTLRVLLADDEELLRDATARLLSRELDCTVVEAIDGGRALAELEADGYRFDLLVLDVDMPRASGIDVLSAVRSVRPEQPVLVRSGDPRHRDAVEALGATFLAKPSAPHALLAAARRLARRCERPGPGQSCADLS
ncbi:MAG TPA: hypothetical protein DEA08_11340 [Planctomycetes bacterium]|nr:hypothetical protein [Planctomycetota bacterium]